MPTKRKRVKTTSPASTETVQRRYLCRSLAKTLAFYKIENIREANTWAEALVFQLQSLGLLRGWTKPITGEIA